MEGPARISTPIAIDTTRAYRILTSQNRFPALVKRENSDEWCAPWPGVAAP